MSDGFEVAPQLPVVDVTPRIILETADIQVGALQALHPACVVLCQPTQIRFLLELAQIQYDRNLLNNPPPHFLEVDRPLFKAIEILENVVDI